MCITDLPPTIAIYFDWLTFNKACIDFTQGHLLASWIVAASAVRFIPKSGTQTFGLDKFCGAARAGKSQRGPEVSLLACVNTLTKQCFALEASQTPPTLPRKKISRTGAPERRPGPTPG